MTVHRVKMCSCTHEELWHPKGGPCLYGRETITGGCTCEAFSRRRKRDVAASPAPQRKVIDVNANEIVRALDETIRALTKLRVALGATRSPTLVIQKPRIETNGAAGNHVARTVTKALRAAASPADGDASPGKAELAMLAVLAERYPKPTTSRQLGVLSGYPPKKSTFRGARAKLHKSGLIIGVDEDKILITAEGQKVAIDVPPLPKGKELVELWISRLEKAPAMMLEAIAQSHPRSLTREELGELTGYEPHTSTFRGGIAALRNRDLVPPKEFRLAAEVMS